MCHDLRPCGHFGSSRYCPPCQRIRKQRLHPRSSRRSTMPAGRTCAGAGCEHTAERVQPRRPLLPLRAERGGRASPPTPVNARRTSRRQGARRAAPRLAAFASYIRWSATPSTSSIEPIASCNCVMPALKPTPLARSSRARVARTRSSACRGRVAVGVREQHDELVAADARDHVGRSKAPPQAVCDGAQHGVACGMSEGVVHGFEPVEVEVGQRQRPAVAPCGVHLALRLVLEPTEVRDAGELVGARKLPLSLMRLVEASDRDRHDREHAHAGRGVPERQQAGRGRHIARSDSRPNSRSRP